MNNIKDFKKGDFFVLSTDKAKIYYYVIKKKESELEIVDHLGNNEEDSWNNFTQILNKNRDAKYEKISSEEGKKIFYISFSKKIQDLSKHKTKIIMLEKQQDQLFLNLEIIRS